MSRPQRYPKARITALSNSLTQKAYIDDAARARGSSNLEVSRTYTLSFPCQKLLKVITGDVDVFDFDSSMRYVSSSSSVPRLLHDVAHTSHQVRSYTVHRGEGRKEVRVRPNVLMISIQMFEHMKNYEMLLRKISTWLRPRSPGSSERSLLFVHIFCHRVTPYHFEEKDGWMAQTFFTGGTMPSHDLLVCL